MNQGVQGVLDKENNVLLKGTIKIPLSTFQITVSDF